jgi:tetratricopeptide (TPR) repeat protein
MRTVYRISQEGSVEADELRQEVLDSNPELAQLAARIASDVKDVESRNTLAEAYLDRGLLKSAYALFSEALNNGSNFRAEIGLARIWDKWQDFSMAHQHAAAAISINAGSAEAHELMGNIYLHRNAPTEAVREFQQALEIAPDVPAVIANLGYAYMWNGNVPDARASFEKALSLDGSLNEARNNLGIILAQMGDYEGALTQMVQAAAPEVALNNLGVVLLSLGNPEGAVQVFQEALKYDPNYEKAQLNLSAARALLPGPVVVNLPTPVSPDTPSAVQVARATPADILAERHSSSRSAKPVVGTLKVPATEDSSIAKRPRRDPEITISSTIPAPQPVADDGILIYALLAILGIPTLTSVTSRWLMSIRPGLVDCASPAFQARSN